MSIVPDRVSALRLVLQQPSPIWAQFTVDDLCLIPKDAKVHATSFVLSPPIPNPHPSYLRISLIPDHGNVFYNSHHVSGLRSLHS